MPTLDWIGKQAVVNHHRDVPYRLVHCDAELSAGCSAPIKLDRSELEFLAVSEPGWQEQDG